MNTVTNLINATVPISSFNRGLAGQIFDDVKRSGIKVVMKNNSAMCVLISPDEYSRIMEELDDAKASAIANERLANANSALSQTYVNKALGIDDDEINSFGEVEFE